MITYIVNIKDKIQFSKYLKEKYNLHFSPGDDVNEYFYVRIFNEYEYDWCSNDNCNTCRIHKNFKDCVNKHNNAKKWSPRFIPKTELQKLLRKHKLKRILT